MKNVNKFLRSVGAVTGSSFVLILALAVFAVSAYALPGTLDNTFGSGGLRMDNISTSDDEILAIAVQSDNKVVVVGFGEKPQQFVVARYTTSGVLDTTFGTNGIVKTAFSDRALARTVAIQSDGKIVVGGDLAGTSFILARYTSSGALDTTFGNQGIVFTAVGTSSGINGLVIQQDGKIVAAGYTESIADFAVARYTTSGALDTSFGGGDGIVTTDFFSDDDRASSIQLQQDGKIVVGGSSIDFDLLPNFAIARYTTSGVLDTSFNSSGLVTTLTLCGVTSVGIQADGKIVAVGSVDDILLARYTSSGALDTSFGSSGIVTTDIGGNSDHAQGLTIKSSGGIIVAGSTTSSGNEDFAIMNYTSSGALDTTFDSGDGIVTTSFGSNSDIGYAVAFQPNGKIVVGGSQGLFGTKQFALARYVGFQPTAALVSVSGRVTNASGAGIQGVRMTLVDSQGNISQTTSSPLGYYTFTDIEVGQSIVVSANSNRHNFDPASILINLTAEVTDANFVSN